MKLLSCCERIDSHWKLMIIFIMISHMILPFLKIKRNHNYHKTWVWRMHRCTSTWNLSKICSWVARVLSKTNMIAILHKKHSAYTGEYVAFIFGVGKKSCHSSLSSFSSPMFQPSSPHSCTLNQRHYTFTQKANVIEKVQAYVAYYGQGCSVVGVCKQCGSNHVNFIKWMKTCTMVKKQLDVKRGQRSPLMVALFWSQVSCCFFEYHEQGMIMDNWQLSIKTC